MDIRKATLDDLPFLIELEKNSFDPSRRFHNAAIKYSINSLHQDVYVLTSEGRGAASAIVHLRSKTWRIYSIAVLPEFRKHSFGRQLVRYIIDEAKKNNIHQITLEADSANAQLLSWYESLGFRFVEELKDFYGLGQSANKMVFVLKEEPKEKHNLNNIVVVDQIVPWLDAIEAIDVITAEQFINDDKYQTNKDLRVFNLCSSYAYQTIGYYVSLLASARNLRAIPNVASIEDFTNEVITESIGDEVEDLIQKTLKPIREKDFTFRILFGKNGGKKYAELAKAIYKLFEAPLLECTFSKNRHWHLTKVLPLTLNDVEYNDKLESAAKHYFNQKRFTISNFKNYRYDLAILVEPEEPAPPSGQTALNRFKLAAEKIGFYTEFITKEDYQRLNQFDALFIRATTNVNDYTYQFSRYAFAEGLAVIDDPWSILKCANKVYFYESMKVLGVLTPKTVVVSKTTPHKTMIDTLGFPMVLKRPDSASSLGVFKVRDEKELAKKLNELFVTSELILAQEYIISTFDWRVGILDNKPLYACKYFMAKNHWQIYNWGTTKTSEQVGDVETLLVENAPKEVIETALKAAAAMGDGFYGVDLKEANGKVYVIEVNDNASIDHHWEDRALGDELYLIIMKSLLSRIEVARNIKNRKAQTK